MPITQASHRLPRERRRSGAPRRKLPALLALLLLMTSALPAAAAAPQMYSELGGGAACTGDPDDGEHIVSPSPVDTQPVVIPAVAPAEAVVAAAPCAVAAPPSPRARLSRLAALWLSFRTFTLHR